MKFLDDLILRWWRPRFSGRSELRVPGHDDPPLDTDREWMESSVPMPIDDSADHQLLTMASDMRHEWFAKLPKEPDWDAYHSRKWVGPAWCPPRGREFPDLEPVSGEIEWRKLHTDGGPGFYLDVCEWPCTECLHSTGGICQGLRETHDYEGGFSDATVTTYCKTCNCGNNIGR